MPLKTQKKKFLRSITWVSRHIHGGSVVSRSVSLPRHYSSLTKLDFSWQKRVQELDRMELNETNKHRRLETTNWMILSERVASILAATAPSYEQVELVGV